MPNYQLTNAEQRLLREQSGLGLPTTFGWLGLVILIMTCFGALALVWWACQLAHNGTTLLAMTR